MYITMQYSALTWPGLPCHHQPANQISFFKRIFSQSGNLDWEISTLLTNTSTQIDVGIKLVLK